MSPATTLPPDSASDSLETFVSPSFCPSKCILRRGSSLKKAIFFLRPGGSRTFGPGPTEGTAPNPPWGRGQPMVVSDTEIPGPYAPATPFSPTPTPRAPRSWHRTTDPRSSHMEPGTAPPNRRESIPTNILSHALAVRSPTSSTRHLGPCRNRPSGDLHPPLLYRIHPAVYCIPSAYEMQYTDCKAFAMM
jgi:hypothetical protein